MFPLHVRTRLERRANHAPEQRGRTKNAPELPIGRFLKSKPLGGNRVILDVLRMNQHFNTSPILLEQCQIR